jgi:hypothetical protein
VIIRDSAGTVLLDIVWLRIAETSWGEEEQQQRCTLPDFLLMD